MLNIWLLINFSFAFGVAVGYGIAWFRVWRNERRNGQAKIDEMHAETFTEEQLRNLERNGHTGLVQYVRDLRAAERSIH